MALYPRVAQILAVVVVLCAAWLMPSLASAHAGHANSGHSQHGAPPAAAENVPAPVAAKDVGQAAPTVAAKSELASAAWSGTDDTSSGCAGRCCGAAAGMPCCGAVQVPEISVAPCPLSCHTIRFTPSVALLGLPPEALPKPPKSFA